MILFVDQSGTMGGGQTVLLSLLRAALDVSNGITLLAPGAGALQAEIVRRFGNKVRFVPCEPPALTRGRKGLGDVFKLVAYTWRFRQYLPLLRSHRLIWCNGSRQLPVLMLLSLLARRKVIYHVHTDYGRLEKFSIRLAASWPSTYAIVSNSPFIAARLGVPSTMIENALDERFAVLAFKNRFALDRRQFRAAVVGTLSPHKGQDIALHAIKDLPIALYLIGGTPTDMKDWASSLTAAIHEGVADDVPEVLDRLSIQFNLVPSAWEEPFGLAAIEGMACSCITIVSGTGGLAEIAKKTCALIAPDQRTLRSTLAQLTALPAAELSALARRQYEATQRAYSPERFAEPIRDLLEAALTPAPGTL